LSFAEKIQGFLNLKGFEVKDEGVFLEEEGSVCYNKELLYLGGTKLINYLEPPYDTVLRGALLQVLLREEVDLVLEELQKEGKIVVKKIIP